MKADGKKLKRNFSTTKRDSLNEFGLQVKNSADGIYHIKLPLVQREHVLIIDNKTVFNDIIYDIAPDIDKKELRYLVTEQKNGPWTKHSWFYLRQCNLYSQWEAWTDYAIGDILHNTKHFIM